jgi:hypothetical protein
VTNHPITPPPKLVERWKDHWFDAKIKHINLEDYILAQAARWGADQELEASLEWLVQEAYIDAPCRLRAARRPKPPSLKELALAELAATERCHPADYSTIRKALEALPND